MGGLPVLPNVVTYQVGFWLCCLELQKMGWLLNLLRNIKCCGLFCLLIYFVYCCFLCSAWPTYFLMYHPTESGSTLWCFFWSSVFMYVVYYISSVKVCARCKIGNLLQPWAWLYFEQWVDQVASLGCFKPEVFLWLSMLHCCEKLCPSYG